MIYIVHGDNTVKSRAQISNQQKKLKIDSRKEFILQDIEPGELQNHLRATSLFGENSLIVLDITGFKGEKKHIEILTTKSPQNTVILYAEKTLPKTNIFIKSIKELDAKIVENKKEHNENIFKFTDTLFSKDRKGTYKEYEKLIVNGVDPFYILNMIYYGLRNIGMGMFKSPSFEKKPGFTKSKTINQLKNFNEASVKKLYSTFYILEKRVKTGEISEDIMVSAAIENVLNSK